VPLDRPFHIFAINDPDIYTVPATLGERRQPKGACLSLLSTIVD